MVSQLEHFLSNPSHGNSQKRFARIGAKGESIDTLTIWSEVSLLKIRCVSDVYGTPKIHKSFSPGPILPLRPIVSSIETCNCKLAQYLGSLSSPHTHSNYATKDSSKKKSNCSTHMVSF